MSQNKTPRKPFLDGAEIPRMQTVKSKPVYIQNGAEVPSMQTIQTAPEKGQSGKTDKK